MVRFGEVVACVALFAFACTQDVDDPANFDSGSPPTDTSGSSSGGDGNGQTNTSLPGDDDDDDDAADQGVDGSTSAGGAGSTGEVTTGPAEDSGDGGNAGCGDGMVSPGEQCDGGNLQGFDCASLGLGSGTLGCDPVTCTFDTSMCMGGGGGTGG
jgi:hypothetical protein